MKPEQQFNFLENCHAVKRGSFIHMLFIASVASAKNLAASDNLPGEIRTRNEKGCELRFNQAFPRGRDLKMGALCNSQIEAGLRKGEDGNRRRPQ